MQNRFIDFRIFSGTGYFFLMCFRIHFRPWLVNFHLIGSFTLWFLLHFVWFLISALYSTFQLQMQEIVEGQNKVKFCKLYSKSFKFLGQKIFPTNYTYSLLLHYLWMHSEWFYIKSTRPSWCAAKFSVTKVSIWWLFLAKVCVFLQLFQC